MREVWFLKHVTKHGNWNYLRDVTAKFDTLARLSITPVDLERGPPTEFLSHREAWLEATLMDHRGITGWEIEGPHTVE